LNLDFGIGVDALHAKSFGLRLDGGFAAPGTGPASTVCCGAKKSAGEAGGASVQFSLA
jgi:hypothetical protein